MKSNTITARSGVGLVLGAGGATGAAFHAGTLLALHHDLGWNPNSSGVIVGSSAGSIVGGLLRAGLTTDDLSAWGASVDPRPAGRVSREFLDEVSAAPHRFAPSVPKLPVPSTSMWRGLLHPSQVRVHTAALALLPHGWIDAATNLERIGKLLEHWLDERLWVTAIRRSDTRRVVFGFDDVVVSPGQAISASCAIPGLFRPVTIATSTGARTRRRTPTCSSRLKWTPPLSCLPCRATTGSWAYDRTIFSARCSDVASRRVRDPESSRNRRSCLRTGCHNARHNGHQRSRQQQDPARGSRFLHRRRRQHRRQPRTPTTFALEATAQVTPRATVRGGN